MTKPKTSRDVAHRARAAVRAQRWVMKHRPKPRPRRHPVLVAAAVMLGSVLTGVLVGTGLEYGRQPAGGPWVLPLEPEPEAPSPAGDAAPLDDGGEGVLLPAAGPETGTAGPKTIPSSHSRHSRVVS